MKHSLADMQFGLRNKEGFGVNLFYVNQVLQESYSFEKTYKLQVIEELVKELRS